MSVCESPVISSINPASVKSPDTNALVPSFPENVIRSFLLDFLNDLLLLFIHVFFIFINYS